MSKTAPKKTKKRQSLTSRVNDLERLIEEYRSNVVTAARNNGARQEEQDKRLTALESRSAPAEEWKPKVGDWVVTKTPAWDKAVGTPMEVIDVDRNSIGFVGMRWTDGSRTSALKEHLRPATEAEVASHKAKEERRAKEAEWAKYDVLQEGDACILSVDLIKELTTLGLRTASETTFTRYDGVQWMFGKLGGYKHGFGPNDSLLEAEFLRRAKGTAAKRLEDDRAKEMAKVPEFGTRVKFMEHVKEEQEGLIASELDPSGYIISYRVPDGRWFTIRKKRHEFTVLD